MMSRYSQSPYDPDNSRNFWGYVVARTIADPPRRGAGRWFAWLIALTCVGSAILIVATGITNIGPTQFLGVALATVGVVLLRRLLSGARRS